MSPRSFKRLTDPQMRDRARFLGDIFAALNTAFQEEAETRGLTKAELARRLDINRALVTRRLGGQGNMTFETLHDMAWAMGRRVEISLPTRSGAGQSTTEQEPLLDQAPEHAACSDTAGVGRLENESHQNVGNWSGVDDLPSMPSAQPERRRKQNKGG